MPGTGRRGARLPRRGAWGADGSSRNERRTCGDRVGGGTTTRWRHQANSGAATSISSRPRKNDSSATLVSPRRRQSPRHLDPVADDGRRTAAARTALHPGPPVPACSSSPIPPGLGQLVGVAPPSCGESGGLFALLAAVPDPRCRRGCRHPLVFVVALAACAVLAGACSLAAIAEWAADAPPDLLIRLGGSGREPDTGPAAPAEATVRSVLQRIDGDALDAAIGTWLAGRSRGGAAAQPAALGRGDAQQMGRSFRAQMERGAAVAVCRYQARPS
ncbi:transposase family protein [Streptomyces sp. NPDC093269]|uniref:transposase family protein n=1 Tax=Streptomyces sp. NPDC093269 TaxID=3366038 RepID=UPI0037F3B4EB